jgi:hypothetical protein
MISKHHTECEEKLAAMTVAEADYHAANAAAEGAAQGVDVAIQRYAWHVW